MRIVLALNSYANLTGSELYVHDLAHELVNRNHDVCILANSISNDFLKHTSSKIKVYPFFDHPDDKPDLVISSQPPAVSYALKAFPQAIHIQVIHSLLAYEEPVIHKDIRAYICVRPEIEAYWVEEKPEIKGSTTVIWNGLNTNKFNLHGAKRPKKFTRLFVGTMDYLRTRVIDDLLHDAEDQKHNLWLVLPTSPFKNLPSNVKVFSPMWDIEKLVKECTETAGIFFGRTTIEGWLCGKEGLVYDVDPTGRITKKALCKAKSLEQFDIKYMTDRILELL